ncbi:hypothetical protein HK104_008376, partial [Borealophlyctis nickersoniae]
MHLPTTLLTTAALTASLASAATIPELIQQNSASLGLSRGVAAIASNPQWGQPGTNTLFLPSDAAIAATTGLAQGDIGYVFTSKKALDWRLGSANEPVDVYLVINDDRGVKRFVWDDYTWGNVPNPDLHIRPGVGGDILAVKQFAADNGFLYILNRAVPDPQPPSTVLRGMGCSAFYTAAQSAGINLDGFKDVTLWAPTDAAMTAAQSRLSTLTKDQQQYVLYNHMTQGITYSSIFTPGVPLRGVLQGATLSIGRAGSESWTIGDANVSSPADAMTSAGVAHAITKVIFPATIPTGPVQLAVTPAGNATTTSTTTTSAVASASTTTSTASAKPSATVKVESSGGFALVVPGITAFLAAAAGLLFG